MAVNIIKNYQDYRSYFEALAESNVDIQSFVYNDDENVINQLRSGSGGRPPIFWLEAYQASVNDQLSDNYMANVTGAFAILQKVSKDRSADQVELECEAIARQFAAKMQVDNQDGTIISEFSQFSYATVDPVFIDNLRGIRMEFSFLIPMGFLYNEDKWT